MATSWKSKTHPSLGALFHNTAPPNPALAAP